MGILDGKKAVIFGVANDKSIAWSVAEHFHNEGAEVILTYASEPFKSRVQPLADHIGAKLVLPCDITDDAQIDATFDAIKDEWGHLDILVHSIAFAKKEELKGKFIDTSRDGFALTMDISAYSLIALTQRAAMLMDSREGSVITLSYLGSERVVQNYNVMGVAKAALESSVRYLAYDLGANGIRINSISAGPIKTLAAMGITGFKDIQNLVKEKSPLKRNVTTEDVAKTAVFLASQMSSGITGQNIYVDSGYSIMGT
jgi:enoyl-[acyl-carrier protein] reductase I